jgi:putative CRISPR-associated protein (TIGR02620 family)
MMTTPETIIVTRHTALLTYLQERGIAPEGARVITHAEPSDVEGKRVIGVLPHRLSCLCSSVVEIPLDIPVELRGVELTIEQLRQYAGEPVEYVCRTSADIDWVAEVLSQCPETAAMGGTSWAEQEVLKLIRRAMAILGR